MTRKGLAKVPRHRPKPAEKKAAGRRVATRSRPRKPAHAAASAVWEPVRDELPIDVDFGLVLPVKALPAKPAQKKSNVTARCRIVASVLHRATDTTVRTLSKSRRPLALIILVPASKRTSPKMTFPDATGQPCDALSDCSVAEQAIPTLSPVPSTSARHESEDYGRYISSAAWQTSPARLAELRAAGYRCRLCFASGEEQRLEVHHRTYSRFRCELAEDLTTLCHDCHLDVTCMERARKYARSPVMPPDHVLVVPPPPLFDYRPALEIAE
jgi:hypothetical protein